MNNFLKLKLFFMAIFLSNYLIAQDLRIFGFVQSSFTRYEAKFVPTLNDYTPPVKVNFMGINQLNLMASSILTEDVSTYLNLEFTNNYSSSKGFGYFNLQEAFIRWDLKDEFKVAFGMLIPSFNSFYEIYNRFPFFPYIARPKMYETNIENVVNLFDILPQKALFQAYGSLSITELNKIDYALYFGNPPNSLISSKDNDLLPGYVAYGQSASPYLSHGFRIGFSNLFMKFGFSYNGDRDNKTKFIVYDTLDAPNVINLGQHNRYRLGGDFMIKFFDFTIFSEIMIVKTTTPKNILDTLKRWAEINPDYNGRSFDKLGYYVTLQYDYKNMFAFFMLDFLNDDSNRYYFGILGSKGFNFGIGYYYSENLIIKTQFIHNRGRYNLGLVNIPVRDYREYQYQFGLSYTF